MIAIECEKLKKNYGAKTVLNGIDLSVSEGEFFGLVGMNGSGKSTMIKAMLDLTAIDSGQINIFNHSHRQVSSRKNIAYLPDRFSPPPYLKGMDFIDYMLQLHGSKSTEKHIHEMLDAIELDKNTLQESVGKLSKGMTQKLGLASCLLSGKSLLILDEPMSGLDPKARVLFKQQLHKIKKQGTTLFFSSHVLADVDELADRIAVLHDCKIMYTGSTEAFKESYGTEVLEDAYMRCIDKKEVGSRQ
jgi:ABC-2 type transport system ATP-binding protein